jgi:predicted MFS family arabinose efflux permease
MGEVTEAPPAAPRPALPGGGWPLLLTLAAVQFAAIIDFMILMPLGPRYQAEMHVGPEHFGVIVAAYSLGGCVSALVAAAVVDGHDRKRALLVLLAGFTVGTFCCAVAPGLGFWPMVLARAVTGFFGGVLGGLVLAIVGDAFPEERRGFATGVVMSAFSLASVAGLPAGLALADAFGTGAPFLVLAGLAGLLLALAAVALPAFRGHLTGPRRAVSPWAVLVHPLHRRAYLLMTCLVFSSFTVVPLLSTYLVANVGFREADLPLMYLFGGAATLVTLSLFGRLADRRGKLPVFRVLALLTVLPVLALTNLPPVPAAVTLTVTTAFMVLTSGRMVPALALVNSCATPASRGSFMTVNVSVQHLAMGLASMLGGALLSRDGDGPLRGYPLVGLIAAASCVVSVFLAGRLRPAEAGEAPASEGLTPAEAA